MRHWSIQWFAAATLALLVGCGPRCFVKKNETVDFYPSYAYQQSDGHWAVPITAWVHENQPDASIQNGISRIVTLVSLFPGANVPLADLQQRVTPFLLRGKAQTTVPVTLEEKTVTLHPTDADGFVNQEIGTPSVPSLSSTASTLGYEAKNCRSDARTFRGEALVIPPNGTSILTDLDGLMAYRSKHDENTTMPSVIPTHYNFDPALAAAYQKWESEGAVIHYFTGSPWQVYGSLSSALTNQGFPRGVLHLKELTFHGMTDSIDAFIAKLSSLFGSAVTTKGPEMENVLQRFPHRRFVFVGDAHTNDQVLFAALARKYPTQVDRIFILNSDASTDDSVERAFTGLSAKTWKIVHDPSELHSLKA